MDAVSLEHTTTTDAVDPIIRAAVEWANAKPRDRLDPMWLYAYADLLRVCEMVQGGRGR